MDVRRSAAQNLPVLYSTLPSTVQYGRHQLSLVLILSVEYWTHASILQPSSAQTDPPFAKIPFRPSWPPLRELSSPNMKISQ